jgi:hypothetical protein
LEYLREIFEESVKDVALKTDENSKHMMDNYSPIDILKLFNGLEIHNLHRAFSKFNLGISLEAFLIVAMRILDIKKKEIPYVLLGLINLFN